MRVYITSIDYDFLNVFGIELIHGRNFSREFSTDAEKGLIINETVAKRMEWENPVGKKFPTYMLRNGEVIGVVKDFHFQTMHHHIAPLALILNPERSSCLCARIKMNDVPGTIAFIEKTYKKFSPSHPFEYYFLDESFNRMYNTEQRLGSIFGYFSFLAIFIACLGLFGLASFTVEQKTKEIGIRKVLGASVPGIFSLLSKGLTKWILLANIISWPLAYYFLNKWLQNFAYRVNLNVWIFILSGLVALAIALLTVSYQTIKAATANPVESLRYE